MDIERFVTYLIAKNLSDNTIKQYCHYFEYLQEIEIELGTEVPLTQEIVESYIADHPNNVARAFMKNYLEHIGRRDLVVPKISGRTAKKKIVLIPELHIQALRNFLYDKRTDYGFLFDLSYYGGLRLNEVINIKLRDFNFDEILSNNKAPIKLLVTGKGDRQRNVVLPKDLLKAIILYSKEKGFTADEKIFKIQKEQWWRIFHKACISLGFVKMEGGVRVTLYHPHSIRHTRSSEWWSKGIDIVSIQQRLGHADIGTTRLYITPNEKKEEEKWQKEYEE